MSFDENAVKQLIIDLQLDNTTNEELSQLRARATDIEFVYETIVQKTNNLKQDNVLKTLKMKSLLALRTLISTGEYHAINFIQTYSLPILQKLVHLSFSHIQVNNPQINKSNQIIGVLKQFSSQFIAQCACVKPYRTIKDEQIQEPSLFALKNMPITTSNYFNLLYFQEVRIKYSANLKSKQTLTYALEVANRICNQIQQGTRSQYDFMQIYQAGDAYVTNIVLSFCQDQLLNLENKLEHKEKYLAFIDNSIKIGMIQPLILLEDSQILATYLKQVEAQKPFNKFQATKQVKTKLYNRYLKCIQKWAFCIPTNTNGKSSTFTIYNDLLADKQFPKQNIAVYKIELERAFQSNRKINKAIVNKFYSENEINYNGSFDFLFKEQNLSPSQFSSQLNVSDTALNKYKKVSTVVKLKKITPQTTVIEKKICFQHQKSQQLEMSIFSKALNQSKKSQVFSSSSQKHLSWKQFLQNEHNLSPQNQIKPIKSCLKNQFQIEKQFNLQNINKKIQQKQTIINEKQLLEQSNLQNNLKAQNNIEFKHEHIPSEINESLQRNIYQPSKRIFLQHNNENKQMYQKDESSLLVNESLKDSMLLISFQQNQMKMQQIKKFDPQFVEQPTKIVRKIKIFKQKVQNFQNQKVGSRYSSITSLPISQFYFPKTVRSGNSPTFYPKLQKKSKDKINPFEIVSKQKYANYFQAIYNKGKVAQKGMNRIQTRIYSCEEFQVELIEDLKKGNTISTIVTIIGKQENLQITGITLKQGINLETRIIGQLELMMEQPKSWQLNILSTILDVPYQINFIQLQYQDQYSRNQIQIPLLISFNKLCTFKFMQKRLLNQFKTNVLETPWFKRDNYLLPYKDISNLLTNFNQIRQDEESSYYSEVAYKNKIFLLKITFNKKDMKVQGKTLNSNQNKVIGYLISTFRCMFQE